MENNVPNNIVERIKKLLIMSQKATLHEKEVAFFKAQELMAKYHLDERDINLHEKMKVVEVTVYDYNIKKSLYASLANMLATNFRCKQFFRGRGNAYYPVFMGMEMDVEVVIEVFKNAYDFAKKESDRIAHYYYNRIGHCRGVREEWLAGFIHGLYDGFKAQVQLSSETAIMIIIPPEVKEAFNKKVFADKSLNLTNAERNGHSGLNRAGYQNGYDLAHNRKQAALSSDDE